LEERLAAAEARACMAEDRVRDYEVEGVIPNRLYTVGTEIPPLPDGPIAVIDISYGSVHIRHEHDPNLWRRMEAGSTMWTETSELLGDGGPYLPVAEDAQGLLRCAQTYDTLDRALRNLENVTEKPDSPWRREVHHGNVVEWATERIRHADEALRRSQGRVRELENELDNWRSGWLTAVAR
jgi:hypothetical protein